jgi:hypothetical protein
MRHYFSATLALSFFAISALISGAALAQAPEQPETSPKPAPEAPGTKPDAPLSKKLHRNEGVLKPPQDIDPEMNKGAPDTGNMPVIIPPGEPGGDQNVQPK